MFCIYQLAVYTDSMGARSPKRSNPKEPAMPATADRTFNELRARRHFHYLRYAAKCQRCAVNMDAGPREAHAEKQAGRWVFFCKRCHTIQLENAARALFNRHAAETIETSMDSYADYELRAWPLADGVDLPVDAYEFAVSCMSNYVNATLRYKGTDAQGRLLVMHRYSRGD